VSANSDAAVTYSSYSFCKTDSALRGLEPSEIESAKDEFAQTLEKCARTLPLSFGSYSLVGLSASADLLLLLAASNLSALQEAQRQLNRTRLARYLQPSSLYLLAAPAPRESFALLFSTAPDASSERQRDLLSGKAVSISLLSENEAVATALAGGASICLQKPLRAALDDIA